MFKHDIATFSTANEKSRAENKADFKGGKSIAAVHILGNTCGKMPSIGELAVFSKVPSL